MYLRHSVRRKDGKRHSYWRLVRSVRRGGKVMQETVAQLGELDARGRASARLLAQQITRGGEQRDLFGAAAADEQRVAVRLDRVGVERARCFGAVWLGWRLWRALRLDEVCAQLLPPGREAIPWAQIAAVLVIGRLCEPASELHLAQAWYRQTALEDLLGLPVERVNVCSRAGDRDCSRARPASCSRLGLEVGGGHVVEQEVVLKGEELAQALAQVLLERRLMWQ